MIPRNEAVNMIKLLLEKTRQGRLCWTWNEQGEFAADFPRFSFLIGKQRENGTSRFFFSLVGPRNELGRMEIASGDSDFAIAEELYEEATRHTALSLFEEAKHALEQAGPASTISSTSTTTTTTPPPLPKWPSREQVDSILSRAAGEWNLDYGRGKEKVVIEASGNYYVKPNEPGKGRPPDFRLTVIACNPDLTLIEWGKDRNNGKRLQIEVLSVAASKMEGTAKHDQHPLIYTRIR
jgi:hypothetical protein